MQDLPGDDGDDNHDDEDDDDEDDRHTNIAQANELEHNNGEQRSDIDDDDNDDDDDVDGDGDNDYDDDDDDDEHCSGQPGQAHRRRVAESTCTVPT